MAFRSSIRSLLGVIMMSSWASGFYSNMLPYGIQIPYPYGVADPLESPKQSRDMAMGDLVLTAEQTRAWKFGFDMSLASVTTGKANARWPTAKVPYEIDCSLKNMPRALEAIQDSMNQWSRNTCVRFTKRTTEKDYLLFVRDSDCWANVGKIDGPSRVSVGFGCEHPNVIAHSVGHTLGLWHQQNKMNRNSYVKINWQNINAYTRIALRRVEDTEAMSGPYDYASIMHYPWDAFSNNGRRSMDPLQRVTDAPFKNISDLDAQQIRNMYGCKIAGRKRVRRLRRSLSSAGEGCHDNNLRCPEWASAGLCRGNGYVFQHCKLSCKFCGKQTASGKCRDSFQSCPVWEKSGFCARGKIAEACKLSCDPGCKSTVNCRDAGSLCTTVSSGEKCSNAWLKRYCTLSCDKRCASKRMQVSRNSACANKYAFCNRWAVLGYCEKFARAAKLCPGSCKAECKVKPTTQVPTTVPSHSKAFQEAGIEEVTVTFPATGGNGIEFGHGVLCFDRSKRCPSISDQCAINSWAKDNCKMTCNSKDCDKAIQKPAGTCGNPLGLSFNGGRFNVSDSAFTASSYFRSDGWSARPEDARLYFMDDQKFKRIGAWCPSSLADGKSSWLQVNLGEQKTIHFIATQGRDKHYERIRKFKISYSNDGHYFQEYEEEGRVRIFNGNCDHFTPVLNKFAQPLIARYVRVHPITYNVPCLRMELYGC